MWRFTLVELYHYTSFTQWAQVQYISMTLPLPTLPGEGSIRILNITWRGSPHNTQQNGSPRGRTLKHSLYIHYICWTIWQSRQKELVVTVQQETKAGVPSVHEDKLHIRRWGGFKHPGWVAPSPNSPWARWLNTMVLHLVCGNGTTISWSWATLHKHWALGVAPEEVDKYIAGDLQSP